MRPVGKFALMIVIGLGVTELVLQLIGFFFVVDWKPDSFRVAKAAETTIVALGESTTDSAYASSGKSWPEFLEEELRTGGFDVTVVNLGRAGTTTEKILATLDEDLREIEPDIVISMIGINDTDKWITQVNRSPFGRIKLYRISTWIWNRLGYLWGASRLLPRADEDLVAKLERDPKISLDDLEATERARLYAHLAMQSNVFANDSNQDARTLHLYRRAFETGHLVEGMTEGYGILLGRLALKEECFELFDRFTSLGGVLITGELTAAAEQCGSDTPEWRHILDRNEEGMEYEFSSTPRKPSLVRVHETISSFGAKHVVMNYPRRPIASKRTLLGEPNDRLVYVENVRNFDLLIEKFGWDVFFVDRFAGDFGHATDAGNKAIAHAAAERVAALIGASRR